MSTINENRPGYKKTKVGWIPKQWESKKLSQIAILIMGQSPPGSSYNQNQTGLPLINGPTEFTEKYPIKKQWTSAPTKVCKKGDILLCVRGSSTGRMNISNDEFCIGRGVAAIRAKESINHDYVEFQIVKSINKILQLTTGSTFPNINSKSLKSIPVPLPPLPEQQKIARILSTWDAAIRKLDQLIERKQTLKKGLMQQLLTGRRRFPEFVPPGGTRYKDTKLGKVPEDWEVVKLKEIAKSLSRKNINDNSDVVLTASAQYGLVDQITFFNKSVAGRDLTKYYLLKKGEFAYNRSYSAGYDYGAIKRLTDYENGALSTLYICFSVNEEQTAQYLVYYFETQLIQRELFSVVQEGARNHGLLNVSKADFYNVNLVIPGKEEMQKITQFMVSLDEEIEALLKRHAQLEQQKKGLMQQLLTGAVRVKA